MGLPVLAVVALRAVVRRRRAHLDPGARVWARWARAAVARTRRWPAALAKLGVGADDVAVISKHDTSTLANDPNETELHERLADALGRSAGAPLFVVSQKSLTGHAKGGAAVFQMMGMCQMLRDGVIPPNRSLDCVDDELASSGHFVWVRDDAAAGRQVPAQGRIGHQSRVRPRVGADCAGAPAGVPGGAASGSARSTTNSAPMPACWPVGAGSSRRSPAVRRSINGPPGVGSATTLPRSLRKRRCCWTRRPGSVNDGVYGR